MPDASKRIDESKIYIQGKTANVTQRARIERCMETKISEDKGNRSMNSNF